MSAVSPTGIGRGRVTARPGAALLIATLGAFLITLDILIVNVALTRIGEQLGGGTTAQQWVIDGYTLAFASLLLFAGNQSDRFGARQVIGVGIAGFTITSLACAVAPAMGLLLAARCVQGATAALLLPASVALIREAYPNPARRAQALGVWAVGGAVATAAGPVLGGALTMIDWRWVFGLNLPVGVAMLAVLPWVPASPRRPRPFDWPGQVLGLLALTTLTYGLIEGGAAGFGEPAMLGLLAVAAITLTGFVVTQRRVHHPMVPPALLRPRQVKVALLAGFAFLVGWYGTVFLISLYLQSQRGMTPLAAGLVFLPSAIVSVFGNLASGIATNRFGIRFPTMVGQLSMVAGLVSLAVLAPTAPPAVLAVLVTLVGAGGSLAAPQFTTLVLAHVPADIAGTASGVLNTFRQVGGALAIAVFGALIAQRAGFVPGMRLSLVIAAACLLATALSFLTIPARTTDHHES